MKSLLLILLTSTGWLFAAPPSLVDSEASHIEIVRRLISVGEEEQHPLLSSELRIHDLASGMEVTPEVAQAGLREAANAFDEKIDIIDIFAAGDRVVVHWRWTGLHAKGAYRGIMPTQKTVSVSGINLYRVEGGKITEVWGNGFDRLHIIEQLIGPYTIPRVKFHQFAQPDGYLLMILSCSY